MRSNLRQAIVLLLGALLLVAPLAVRFLINGARVAYQPPAVELPKLVVTPIPTATAEPASTEVVDSHSEPDRKVVWVDLAHFSPWLDPSRLESLAAGLNERGVGLRFWLSSVDTKAVESYEKFPDQSVDLATRLQDAAGLVVVSPYYLWTPAEVAVVEEFVADGGHLLLVSDPDMEDTPRSANSLGEPFGIVFNDDYLYDLTDNDSNYTHVFLGEFLDQATALNGNKVAFYGARSISGPVISQVRSADTTLSSLRTGLTRFTTLAIGGHEANGTTGRVLAMGDFDVITEPYVTRHDNRVVLEFVADFLANAQREQTLPDFPGYLGRRVALIFGGDTPVDANLLKQGGALQQRLEDTGRTLTLSSSTPLSLTDHAAQETIVTATPSAVRSGNRELQDLIYLGTFQAAEDETTLLADAGIRLVKEMEAPEGTEMPPAANGDAAEELPPTAGPTPESTSLLVTDRGLRLLAAETVLVLQQEHVDGYRTIAVLGDDSQAIGAGLDRLLSHLFDDCVNYAEMSICPFFREEKSVAGPEGSEPGTLPDQTEESSQPGDTLILVVDDNDTALPEEASEAALYLRALNDLGYTPVAWSTAERGSPDSAELARYDWVIWSSGVYEKGGPDSSEEGMLQDFISNGGKLTLSGRNHPLAGESPGDPSAIVDIETTQEVPALVVGFPEEPIQLPAASPPVLAMQLEAAEGGPDVVTALRRGPASGDAGAPLLVVLTSTGEPDAAGMRVTVLGMALNWLPDEYALQLAHNMAVWMLEY